MREINAVRGLKSSLKLAQMEFRAPALLSDEEIAEVLKKVRRAVKWASDVYALPRTRRLSTARGPAMLPLRDAPTASTHPTRRSRRRQRQPGTATFTSTPSSASKGDGKAWRQGRLRPYPRPPRLQTPGQDACPDNDKREAITKTTASYEFTEV